jgi:hypothetical protein
MEAVRAAKENVVNRTKRRAVVELGKITRIHTVNLSKFDLNDPSSLAAYASPYDSAFGFDSDITYEDLSSKSEISDLEEKRSDEAHQQYLLSFDKA